MRLFGKVDGVVDRHDRPFLFGLPFDISWNSPALGAGRACRPTGYQQGAQCLTGFNQGSQLSAACEQGMTLPAGFTQGSTDSAGYTQGAM